MNAAVDTEFYRAFAGRVRETLAAEHTRTADHVVPPTGARTVTVRLHDAPGALMTVACPSWCTDDHAEDITRGTFAEDFAHRGDESAFMVPKEWGSREDVLIVQIHQYPFGKDMREPTAILWPTLGLSEVHLDSNGVGQLADRLRGYARELDAVGSALRTITGPTFGTAAGGHFPWCSSHHTDVCDDGTRLTDHMSVRVSVPAPPGMYTRGNALLTAALYFSENTTEPETLLSIGGSGEGTVLTAAEADQVIGDLASFVDTLRALRGQMGGAR